MGPYRGVGTVRAHPGPGASGRRSVGTFASWVLGATVLALLLELVFRRRLVATSYPTSRQDPADLILRFDTAGLNSGVGSQGPLARNRVRWRINNDGWNCEFDYTPRSSSRPRIALLGDSFIEGLATDVSDHIESYLHRAFNGRADVYAFGRSNWYLEQYVAVSRYVEEKFSPDVYVIFLNVFDVWWSLREKGITSPYLFQICRSGDGFVELKPTAICRSRRTGVRRLAERSALFRYLRNNLELRQWLQRGRGRRFATTREKIDRADEQPQQPQGQDAVLLRDATSYLVRTLVAEHPRKTIIFVESSDRPSVYLGRSEPRRSPEVEAVEDECDHYDSCCLFDLWPVYVADYARNHHRFEAYDDSHWNQHANQVIAQGLFDFLQERRLL